MGAADRFDFDRLEGEWVSELESKSWEQNGLNDEKGYEWNHRYFVKL